MPEEEIGTGGIVSITVSEFRSKLNVENGAVSLETVRADDIVLTSEPPSGFHRVYGMYAKKVGGGNYHLMLILESEPEP